MQSLRRLDFAGCQGLVRNPKEFLDPLSSSKSLKTIGVCINADLVLIDRFLPDYASYQFRDETREGSQDPMSVVLRSDRTSWAYVRTLCDLFEEKRWEIQFIDDPEDFPISPGSLMKNNPRGQMSIYGLHRSDVSDNLQSVRAIGFLHK